MFDYHKNHHRVLDLARLTVSALLSFFSTTESLRAVNAVVSEMATDNNQRHL